MPNRINYQLEMEKVLRTLDGTRPRLLLHACCARARRWSVWPRTLT